MIKINYKKTNDSLTFFEATGHANHDKYGKDIVCAGVSSIIVGALNSFDLRSKDDMELIMDNNLIKIKVINNNPKIQIMFQMMMDQLETIRIQYNDKIMITEVL